LHVAKAAQPVTFTPIFKGLSITSFICLELFCGTAGLTASLRIKGFDAIGFDHSSNRHFAKAPISTLDLSKSTHQQLIFDIIDRGAVFYIHLGLPCGTASRARDRPVAAHLVAQGSPNPQKLRSEEHPRGLPTLEGEALRRVSIANELYDFGSHVVAVCLHRGIRFSVENPRRSYLWLLCEWQALLARDNTFCVDFQNCMRGGFRDKWSRFYTNMSSMSTLALSCDGSHTHKPWSIQKTSEKGWAFSTADEAAYPHTLCDRVAAVVHSEALNLGIVPLPDSIDKVDVKCPQMLRNKSKAVLGALPRGHRLPQLLSEFDQVIVLKMEMTSDLSDSSVLARYPSGAKILRRQILGGSAGSSSSKQDQHATKITEFAVGVPREPWNFVAAAAQVGHPRSWDRVLPQLFEGMLALHERGDCSVIDTRAIWFKKWISRAAELKAEEAAFTDTLPVHIRNILRGKRLLLMKEILLDIEYPDSALFEDVTSGFSLTGWMRESGVFQKHLKPPVLSIHDVLSCARVSRVSVVSSASSSGDVDLDAAVWEATQEEISKGWIEGPFNLEALEENAIISRRFGIVQGGKVRVIDDFSESSVNLTTGTTEKLSMMTVDESVALAMEYSKRVLGPRADSEGNVPKLVGRTYDLKSAYRQVPLSEKGRTEAYIVVYSPSDKSPAIYRLNCLPFGATASVYAFNRCALMLWCIGVTQLALPWTNFYDDFTCITHEQLADNTAKTIELFFDLLGWSFARDGKKAQAFSDRFDSLGVTFDFSRVNHGQLAVCNTERRVQELSELISAIIHSNRLSPKLAQSMCSRLLFAEGQTFGRRALQAIKGLRGRSTSTSNNFFLDDHLRLCLLWLKDRVLGSGPKTFSLLNRPVWMVYTDGACEGEGFNIVTCGGVLFDACAKPIAFFGVNVPVHIVEKWSTAAMQKIGQAELLPVWISIQIWKKQLENSDVVFYLDNDAARQGLVKGFSPAGMSNEIISAILDCEEELSINSWFARVQTSSNVADAPSRLVFDELLSRGASRVSDVSVFECLRSGTF
jgi:hypothetical protein